MRKLMFLCVLLLLCAVMILPVGAAAPRIHDDADLLTPEEEASVAADLGDSHGVAYYLITSKSYNTMGDNEPIYKCNIPSDQMAVVLVVYQRGSQYNYDMYTYNGAEDIFSDSDVDFVLDHGDVYPALKGGRIADGAKAFFRECNRIVQADAAAAQARHDRAPLMGVVIGLIVGLLAGGGAALGVFLYYRRKLHGEVYPLDRYAQMNLTECRDQFMGSFVTRVRVQTSSSSGGGRSGGGGGFSGGHRGGR